MRVEAGELDLDRFRALVDEARAAEPEAAADLLRRALALWRGPVLADLDGEPVAAAAAHLDELRVAALEERIEDDLALGRHADLVPELEALVEEHPFRERLRRQLVLALYRSGRPAEALDAYASARRTFVEELGTEPGEALQELHRAVLRQAPELATPEVRPEPFVGPAAHQESRKVVTVLVAALGADGDTLDPEARRALLRARGDEAAAIAARHGGAAERLGDDRLLAVFGVPFAHDDDGLRAVAAAFELGAQRLAAAVATGEVITGDPESGGSIVAGAVVEEAGRLLSRAAPGEILATERTWRLVRHAVRSHPDDGARRLDSFDPDAPALPRRRDTPFVGRSRELDELEAAYERVSDERRVRLVTLFGAPGIGKTRLAVELLSRVGRDATCMLGSCWPGQEDSSYAPLREAVTGIAGPDPGAGLGAVLAGEPEGELIAARVAAAIGAGTDTGPVEETAWAVRRLLEALARSRPVVLVLEDVHWAAPVLLDLVVHVATLARGPILLVCLARPELLETRPGWGGGSVSSTSILLEALSDDESQSLLDVLSPTDTADGDRARILSVAEGNPLFLEQLLAAQVEGQAEAVPDSIYGLLASRLDRLAGDERTIAEAAAVCGTEFSAASVEELTGLDALPALASLASRQLVQVAEEQSFAEETWTFRHGLIREAAYEAVPKRRRAALHEAFARRVIHVAEARGTQWDELAGYHLEQAVRCLEEVGEGGASLERLRVEAGERLADAGYRAYERHDMAASASILERAARLLPADSATWIVAATRLSAALTWRGALEEQHRWLEEARAAAERRGDERLIARVRLTAAGNVLSSGRAPSPEALLAETDAIIPVLEAAGDHEGLAQASIVRFHGLTRANRDGGPTSLDRGLEHARRAGSRHLEGAILNWFCVTLPRGAMPTGPAAEWCLELLENPPNRLVRAGAFGALGLVRAMQGSFEEARALVEEDDEILLDLGLVQASAAHSIARGEVETIAGDFPAAERILRSGIEQLETLGDVYSRTNAAWRLAVVLSELRRDEEADVWATVAAEAPPTGIYVDIWWRLVRAAVRARRGEPDEARVLLVEALDLRGQLGGGDSRDIWIAAAEAYELIGQDDEAERLLREALGVAERKEYAVAAERARRLLSEG